MAIPQYETHHAEWIERHVRHVISDSELANVDVEARESALHRGIELSIRTLVAATKPVTISVHRQWPRDWWQAVKERWAPKWALRRWPVKYELVDIEETIHQRQCPHVVRPDNRRCLEWLTLPDDAFMKVSAARCGRGE